MTRPAPLAHESIVEAATEVARRQWRAIGARVGAGERVRSIVDPEALLHYSAAVAPREPKLMEAMTPWMALHSSLLSVQRVRNLTIDFPPDARDRLALLARVAMDEGKDARWAPLADGRPAAPRPRRKPTRAIQRRFTDTTALLLQLRLGMGVGVKADVLAYLLAAEGAPLTAPDIADATRYTVVAVRRAADEMSSAHFLHAERGGDGPTTYSADPGPWAPVLGVSPPIAPWRGWRERFAFVAELLDWESASADPELLVRHAAALEFEGAPPPEAGLEAAIEALGAWMVASA